MNLADFLGSKKTSTFKVKSVGISIQESTGEKIALLYLETPIPIVEGSQKVKDDATGESVRIEAYDVEVVRVFARDQNADGIDIDPVTGKGTVACDLQLDVTQAGDVILTSESLAAWGRKQQKAKSGGGVLARIRARKEQIHTLDIKADAEAEAKIKAKVRPVPVAGP